MDAKARPSLRPFWLRLALIYIVLTVLWPVVLSTYSRNLGNESAPFIKLFAYDRVDPRTSWSEGKLILNLSVYSLKTGENRNIRLELEPIRYGLSHIAFMSLALAIPGFTWRQRLVRWLIGGVTVEGYNIFVLLLNVFGDIAKANAPFWSGDLVTAVCPQWLYGQSRNFATIIGAQFVPIGVWLAMFVYPRPRSDSRSTTARPAA